MEDEKYLAGVEIKDVSIVKKTYNKNNFKEMRLLGFKGKDAWVIEGEGYLGAWQVLKNY